MQSTILKLSFGLLIFFINYNVEAQVLDPNPSFLVISDIHLYNSLKKQTDNIPDQKDKNGKPIAVTINAKFDIGENLWNSTLKVIDSIIKLKKPKFILVLGDLCTHVEKKAHENLAIVLKNLRDSICNKDNIPIALVSGNNDSQYGDYAALTKDSITDKHNNPLLNPNKNNTIRLLDTSKIKDLGCYSAYPLKDNKLRLIVLNTVIFHKRYPLERKSDSDSQMHWFEKQLDSAKKEKILIAMHIPPGLDGFPDSKSGINETLWADINIQNRFLEDIKNNANIIGLLAGHSHMDGMRLLRDKDQNPSALLISVPGIAPGHGNNPGIKTIEYDPNDSFKLKDFTTYYMKYWSGPNDSQEAMVAWDSAYSFKSEFRNNNMSLFENVKTMINDDSTRYAKKIEAIYSVKSNNENAKKNVPCVTIYVNEIGKQ